MDDSSGATERREKAEASHREGSNGAGRGIFVVLTRLSGFIRESQGHKSLQSYHKRTLLVESKKP